MTLPVALQQPITIKDATFTFDKHPSENLHNTYIPIINKEMVLLNYRIVPFEVAQGITLFNLCYDIWANNKLQVAVEYLTDTLVPIEKVCEIIQKREEQ